MLESYSLKTEELVTVWYLFLLTKWTCKYVCSVYIFVSVYTDEHSYAYTFNHTTFKCSGEVHHRVIGRRIVQYFLILTFLCFTIIFLSSYNLSFVFVQIEVPIFSYFAKMLNSLVIIIVSWQNLNCVWI